MKKMKLKPPISRMGGKSKLKNEIIKRIPDHICYAEVFLGAGWVYFSKEKSKVEVINDLDGELINLFRSIKNHTPEVERLLQYETSSRDSFEEYLHKDIKGMTEIQRAIRFLYLISQSFAAKGKHFGYSASKNPPSHIYRDLEPIRDRLKNTYIENIDYKKLIKKYDREHTFFFCDPPYFETEGYDVPFGKEDHIELKNILSKTKGKWLLTINDHPFIRELYSKYKIEEIEVLYTVSKSKNKKFGELIITNY